jgi:osmoprotectant transport system permease protein
VRPFEWSWIFENADLLGRKLVEHLELTLIAVGLGLLISVPLGIYSHRHRIAYPPIASVAGLLYTIPSLALFAFLLPWTGLTVTTAEIGLVSYTLLILIRNIVSGLQGVPADTKEAAVGMGYSRGQLLWRVEMPLALPVIIAGIRLATVTTIGLVTVTSLIGFGGFGFLILDGFRDLDSSPLIVGAVASTLLAVFMDAFLVGAEQRITPWARRRTAVRAFG